MIQYGKLCIFPLGGYVKFAGEMYPDKIEKSDKKKYKELFMYKGALQKASIVLAGPFANFVLGIFLFSVIYITFGKIILHLLLEMLIKIVLLKKLVFKK